MRVGYLLGAATAVAGFVGSALAPWCSAEALKYQFKDAPEVVYDVTIKADTPDVVDTYTGRITYSIKSVDSANGQISFSYGANLNEQKQAKRQEDPQARRFPPMPTFPPMSNPFAPARPSPDMLISPLGKVLRTNAYDEQSSLPFTLGTKWQLLLPPLSRDGAPTWKEEQDITLYTKRGNERQWPPPPPWQRQAEERVDRPAHETITYTLGTPQGNLVPIQRQYTLETEQKNGPTPLLKQTSQTQFMFNTAAGLVESMEMTGTIEINEDNVNIRVPLSASAKRLSAEAMAKLKAEQEAAAAAAKVRTEKERKWAEGADKADERTTRTPLLGGTGGGAYARIDPGLRPMTGVRFTFGDWGGRKCVRRVEPLYEQPSDAIQGEGTDIIAKPGYAVAGLVVNNRKQPAELWGMQVIFMRLQDGKLVTADQYRSQFVCDVDNKLPKTILGGKGELVVGVYGREGLNADAIGLVMLDPNAPAKTESQEEEISAAAPALTPAEQLKRIESNWQKTTAKPVEILGQMQGRMSRGAEGVVTLPAGTELTTTTSYHVPATFRFVCMSDTKDIRIRYGADQIILNWEMRPDELRVDGGPAGGMNKPTFGRLPANEWVAVEMVYTAADLTIYVNGKQRYRGYGNFSAVNQPFTIRAHNGELKLKSVAVVR